MVNVLIRLLEHTGIILMIIIINILLSIILSRKTCQLQPDQHREESCSLSGDFKLNDRVTDPEAEHKIVPDVFDVI